MDADERRLITVAAAPPFGGVKTTETTCQTLSAWLICLLSASICVNLRLKW
jgi:hypothetical protein